MTDNESGPLDRLVAVIASVGAGAMLYLQSFLTLDPAFLLSGDWYGIASLFTRFIGPEILPSLPWNTLFFIAAVGMLVVSLYKFRSSQNETK
ncbi:hypothetical protein E6P09_07615 [Haloferax mediterranei ATCC 33500]|uniref:Uncharacterized protein n=1 Tax=Haloferax mediterranei (strain ATCC 33500 / DSM 1411 / JCM 8866 / NBRC 14739 / NCIMB 2177 / R-4) TaxID=523841 RepID=I3R325_HALMT|nr:hypothetical protein [Haloferax mediterranei]AFK18635.1 hypothetical protein HFX_0914 [Haloferax mediterranei ATCC 33500]AHZ21993.1 hypothetical protein BM92_04645 [Haloferax mediterranei ATCC 33500]EMA02089.1 hypothetical protein C439_05900 [Haloferax mediterranei ATCC 33500]MDX5988728.1 hypothetical protein [Haloferax mediterranei ATCC 33500]QCQ75135.1 hypothetical protein E6P09_07615 [Haloferax mediterranei ATCC 33500]